LKKDGRHLAAPGAGVSAHDKHLAWLIFSVADHTAHRFALA
jgi:hypothetical protein